MTLITQKFDSDCAVACLAMFLGVKYDAVAKHCHGFELVTFGLCGKRTYDIAELFGSDILWRDVSKLNYARPAVLTVPSLNIPGGRHSVYWDGSRLYDPNDGRPHKRVYDADSAWSKATDGYQRDED